MPTVTMPEDSISFSSEAMGRQMLRHTPTDHDATEPCGRGNLADQDVARDFEEDVGDEENL